MPLDSMNEILCYTNKELTAIAHIDKIDFYCSVVDIIKDISEMRYKLGNFFFNQPRNKAPVTTILLIFHRSIVFPLQRILLIRYFKYSFFLFDVRK